MTRCRGSLLWCSLSYVVAAGCTASSDDGTSGVSAPAESSSASASGESSSAATVAPTSSEATSDATTTTTSDTSTGADSSESSPGTTGDAGTRVQFETTMGTIVFELDEVAAPVTSANFLAYVDAGFFDGTDGAGATIFHRVIPGFVIQGGGLTETLGSKVTMAPIMNEFGNGLLNVRGSISMARTNDPDSATSQFFVNLVDNGSLDTPPGYAVFGAVVEGMEVVDAIASVATTSSGPYDDVPVDPIIVTSAVRL